MARKRRAQSHIDAGVWTKTVKKRILVLGSSGLLGSNLSSFKENEIELILNIHKRSHSNVGLREVIKCDLSNVSELSATLKREKIDAVINCVGLADVDRCEIESDKAEYLNIQIPMNIASACREQNTQLVHISTDHLGGDEKRMMKEGDKVLELKNIYAKTKYEGEKKILENNKKSAVVRCSFFCGTKNRKSLMAWIMENLNSGTKINMYKDVYFTPVHAVQVWEAVFALVKFDKIGIYNVASRIPISKYEFGLKVASHIGANTKLINGVEYDEYAHLRTIRPKNMCLDGRKFEVSMGIKFCEVEEALKKYEAKQ